MKRKKTWRGFDEIDPLDQLIHKTLDAGMESGVLFKIEFQYGFEEWGAYENWRGGYIVSGRGQKAASQYLDTAIQKWAALVEESADPAMDKKFLGRRYMEKTE